MGRETAILNECLMALSEAGCKVWRNNVGALPNRNGRLVSYGLCKGSADIIGICPDGIMLAVEVKTKTGRTPPDQDRFLALIRQMGGRAGVARSAAEAVALASGQRAP